MDSKKHPTEEKYPKQTKAFRELIDKMYAIHLDKNQDYSPANILVSGEVGIIVRIWDKYCRICNLMGVPFPAMIPEIEKAREKFLVFMQEIALNKTCGEKDLNSIYACANKIFDDLETKSQFDWSKYGEKEPANEPLDDAYLDASVYLIIGYLHRKGLWGK